MNISSNDVCHYCKHSKLYKKEYVCITCEELGGYCNFEGISLPISKRKKEDEQHRAD